MVKTSTILVIYPLLHEQLSQAEDVVKIKDKKEIQYTHNLLVCE